MSNEKYCCQHFEQGIEQKRIIYNKKYNKYLIWTFCYFEDNNDWTEDISIPQSHIMDYCLYCGANIGNHYE